LFRLPIDSEQEGIEYVLVMNKIKYFDVNVKSVEYELHGDTRIIDETLRRIMNLRKMRIS
jgi:hypothetical protein